MPLIDSALRYLNHFGYSIIPVGQDKKPLVKWEEFQKRKPTEVEVKQWWVSYPEANIGIVTGEVSNLSVVDVDTEEASHVISDYIPESLECPTCQTPRGGHHLYFRYSGHGSKNGVLKNIDFKSNGGYVLAPPSQNGNGNQYVWNVKPSTCPPPDLPSSFIDILNKALSLYISTNTNIYNGEVSSDVVTFKWPKRDEDIFHSANCLAKGGMREENARVVCNILKDYANSNSPDASHLFTEKDVEEKLKSAYGRKERSVVKLSSEIREHILNEVSPGVVFLSSDVVSVVNVSSREERKALSKILSRLCEEKNPLIERFNERPGYFRKINKTFEEIKYWEREKDPDFPIVLPMGLSKLCRILPGAVIIVAGVKSAGKTAFMLNLIKDNMGLHGRSREDIIYMTTELSKPELTDRLIDFRGISLESWRFTALDKRNNWSECITDEKKIFVLDYLDITKDFYNVGDEIKKISDKLRDGIAVIGIQKPPGRDEGLGGAKSMDKARLYIALDRDRVKIVDAKAPREKGVRNKIRKFELEDRGTVFSFKTDWITEEEEKEVSW